MAIRFRFAALAVSALLGACDDAPTTPPARTSAAARAATRGATDGGAETHTPAAATLGWNALAQTLVERAKPNQQYALRAFAYLAAAQHRAIVALDDAVPGAATTARGRQALVRVALSRASAEVLGAFFPADAALIEQHLAAALAAVDPAPSFLAERIEAAQGVGASVAQGVLARAQRDGFDRAWSGTVPTGFGVWASQLAPPRPPLLPMLGQARTFFMTRGDQFRPAPPPAVGSPAFQAALAEVRHYSDTRTPEQRKIAEFWAMATGSLAAGYWNQVADSLIARDRLGEADAAHVLALMNMAAWDANVACHDAKYTYWLARPTQMDPGIALAIGLPNHPSYPSNHGCLSGAAAEILAARFPADAGALRAQEVEAIASRVYAGLHYRFDGEAGLGIAAQVSALALRVDRETGGRLSIE